MSNLNKSIAVAYLARGADKDWLLSCERFLRSYRRYHSGVPHSLYIIFKGFLNDTDLELAKTLFGCISHEPVFLEDDKFDIGAYIEWAGVVQESTICVFNTASEILAPDWLLKLALNLTLPGVGLVGATASYESLCELNSSFPVFPNIHLRSTAFMVERESFVEITSGLVINNKVDAFGFESGRRSLTRRVLAMGRAVLLVGRNGRGYSPQHWVLSDTFRQGTQQNLLVADNQTRNFDALPWNEKREFSLRTWGDFSGLS